MKEDGSNNEASNGSANMQQTSVKLVDVVDGKIMTNSRKVAEAFEKRHCDLLKAIRELECPDEFTQRNFASIKIKDLTGESTSHVNMTRDGFTFLAMGFTGKKAAEFKIKYITAFSAMEEELKRQAEGPVVPKNYLEALQSTIVAEQGRIAAEEALKEAQPKVAALERIQGSDGSMNITNAAKTLNMRPKDLFNLLSAKQWIYKRVGSKNWIAYQSRIQSGLLEHCEHIYLNSEGVENIATRCLVTAKGLTKLSELRNEPPLNIHQLPKPKGPDHLHEEA